MRPGAPRPRRASCSPSSRSWPCESGAPPYLIVGWLWYLGMLVPVLARSGGEQAMADRYTYLPMIGIAVAAMFGLRDAVLGRPRLLRPLAVATVMCSWLGRALSARQLRVWENGQRVFEHALAVTEGNYFAHNIWAHLENRASGRGRGAVRGGHPDSAERGGAQQSRQHAGKQGRYPTPWPASSRRSPSIPTRPMSTATWASCTG